jgi:glycosyltransferase involved in cell wall biosynthesis
VIVRDGFHSDALLDKYVAASDVAPIAIAFNGPSGIMGKASAAGVPVVTAGSEVRARELIATGGGEVADFTPSSIGAAIRRVLAANSTATRNERVPLATADEFSRALLGVDRQGHVRGRSPRRSLQR